MGEALFCGDPSRQVSSKYYYSGGGTLHEVSDIESARNAIDLIIGQGEGLGGNIYDKDNELAHYYRFDQIRHGRYFQKGDTPDNPTGPELDVDWDAVYSIKTDLRIEMYPEADAVTEAAREFNENYRAFLSELNDAFNGTPSRLLQAVPSMFKLRDKILQLMRTGLPGTNGLNAAPTFEVYLD